MFHIYSIDIVGGHFYTSDEGLHFDQDLLWSHAEALGTKQDSSALHLIKGDILVVRTPGALRELRLKMKRFGL